MTENEQKEEETAERGRTGERASGGTRRGAAGAPVVRGVGVAAPLAMSAPPRVVAKRAGAGFNPSPRVVRFL